MELNSGGERVPPEQLTYAVWLNAGTRTGLALLVVTFAVYVSGALPPQIDFADLPRLWSLPVDRYLAAAGLPSGWGWVAFLGHGDMLNFVGIAFLALVTFGCYLRLALALLQRSDFVFAFIALAEIAVLALAVSGLVAGLH